jgi:nucleoside-diphosphate-sugar epimerase
LIHLAAEPYIPYCYQNPALFFETNATGTLNVLMAAKRHGLKRVLHYSSSEIYGTAQQKLMNENHPLNPHSTYAVSKLAGDRLCWTFHKEHKLPVTIIRQFNCFGPRETQPYVIPEIIRQLSKGTKLKLGNLEACRDFTYVADAARACIDLMECDQSIGEVVNIGTSQTRSIREIAHEIGKAMKKIPDIEVEESRLRPYDVDVLQCDYRKLHSLTRWEPTTSFTEGIKRTVKFFKSNRNRWDYRR